MRYVLAALLALPTLAAEPGESAGLAAQREKMKQRMRRLIYNSDGGDIFAAEANTVEGFYAQRMDATIGGQVDSVFYCTGATLMFSHLARAGETYGRYCDDMTIGRNVRALAAAGHDVLDLVVAHGHEHGKEIFFTHRINDIHDAFAGAGYELATWKRRNPQYLMARQSEQGRYSSNDTRFFWSALDFEHEEVRDQLLACVQDVCSRYDIDGYEVDYFRSPLFFRPNLDDEPAAAEHLAMLTDFQRQVRDIARREGNRRGRPILVCVRVPMTVAKCRHVGIDIRRWLVDDLLDLMTTGGGYVPFTMPTRELVELGHRYDKPVYPTISASGMRRRFSSIEAWRGAASNAWACGADGIVLFNTFPGVADHPHFTMLGDPERMRYGDKVFGIDDARITEADLAQGIQQHQALPVRLWQTAEAVLPVGDDVAAAARAGRLQDVSLLVRYQGLAAGEAVDVCINGGAVKSTGAATGLTVPGRIGRAFRFDGLGVLTAGNPDSLQVTTGDFTFAFWVRTRQKERWSGFLRFNQEPDHVPAVKLYFNDGIPTISFRTVDKSGDWTVGGGDVLVDDEWHHLAATFDRDGDAIVYVDGESVGAHDISDRAGSLGTGKFLMIGCGDWNFIGLMDDLRIYDRALGAEEVRRIATRPSDEPEPGALLGWWKFDEASGTSFADSSGRGHTARFTGADGNSAWMTYKPDPAVLKQGDNRVVFLSGLARELSITNVELHVAYGGGP